MKKSKDWIMEKKERRRRQGKYVSAVVILNTFHCFSCVRYEPFVTVVIDYFHHHTEYTGSHLQWTGPVYSCDRDESLQIWKLVFNERLRHWESFKKMKALDEN